MNKNTIDASGVSPMFQALNSYYQTGMAKSSFELFTGHIQFTTGQFENVEQNKNRSILEFGPTKKIESVLLNLNKYSVIK